MTNTTAITFTTIEEMNEFLVSEVKKASKRASYNSNVNEADLESYLMIRVWTHVMNNEKYQTVTGIRQVIKSRVINFLKSPTNHHSDVDVFSSLSSSDDEGNESDYEVIHHAQIEDTVIDGNLGQAFLTTLSDTHRQILELKIDGFQVKEIASVVFPNHSYESARKSVNRNLKAITELALDFGLEEI